MTYNKHLPLDEYYLYNGSFSAPPCEENVKYIINPIIIYAPFEQILHFSSVLIMNGNTNGNNRSIQSSEKIKIFHYKKSDILDNTINELDLFEKKERQLYSDLNV